VADRKYGPIKQYSFIASRKKTLTEIISNLWLSAIN